MKPLWLEHLEQTLVQHAHIPSSVFAQMATVSVEHRPANRTVVFRGFSSAKLLFATRMDSEKIEQLLKNPWAEVCWYFIESREQYRILGTCQVITAADQTELAKTRATIWHSFSPESKQMLTWPASGQPLSNLQAFQAPVPEGIPESLVVLALVPEQVDLLSLGAKPHQRTRHMFKDGHWQVTAINP